VISPVHGLPEEQTPETGLGIELETLEVVEGAGGAWVDGVLFGSKNWAALWLVLVDVGVVEVDNVVEVVKANDEVEVASGSENPGVTQMVSVYPTISVSVTQSVTMAKLVATASRLLCLAICRCCLCG
jgi:hypothetical protein